MADSFASLTAAEKTLLARLAIVEQASLAAAHAIGTAAGDLGADLEATVSALVEQGLLQRHEGAGQEVYLSLPESLRQEAQALLSASGDEATTRRAHAAYYAALVEELAPGLAGPQRQATLSRLNPAYPDLRAALRWAISTEETGLAVRLAGSLFPFWVATQQQAEGRELLDAVLAQGRARNGTDPLPTPAWAKALQGAGMLALTTGDLASAQSFLAESLALYRSLDDKNSIAAVLGSLGMALADQDDYTGALAAFEELYALKQAAGDQRGVLSSLNSLALINLRRGDYQQSQAMYAQALALGRQLNIKPAIAMFLNNLGYVQGRQGDYTNAIAAIEESITVYREIGAKKGVAESLGNLADIATRQHDAPRAIELYGQSITLSQEAGDQENVADCLEGLAAVSQTQGQAERAARLLGSAEALRTAIATPVPPSKRAQYNQTVQAVRDSLDPTTFETAWREGTSLALEQVLHYALQDSLA